jgi:hypothetical protein
MNEIERTQQRTRGYWYYDGIAELVGGLALLLVGVPMFAAARTGIGMLSTVALLMMILLFPVSARVVLYLKDRITHTRTGYVKYPRPSMSKRRKVLLFCLLLCVAAVIFISVRNGDYTLDSIVGRAFLIGSGAGMAVAFAVRAVKLNLLRMLAVTAAATAVTVLNAVWGTGFIEGMGLLLSALGATSVLTGGVVLPRYMKRHPKARSEMP